MKAVSFLIRLSLVASAFFGLALFTGHLALATFGAASSALLLSIAARDYARPARRWQPGLALANAYRSEPANRFRLAA